MVLRRSMKFRFHIIVDSQSYLISLGVGDIKSHTTKKSFRRIDYIKNKLKECFLKKNKYL